MTASSFAWAAILPPDYNNPGSPYASSVRRTRDEVIRYMGRAFANEGETDKKGWSRARRAGWRVQRVEIRALTGETGGAL